MLNMGARKSCRYSLICIMLLLNKAFNVGTEDSVIHVDTCFVTTVPIILWGPKTAEWVLIVWPVSLKTQEKMKQFFDWFQMSATSCI